MLRHFYLLLSLLVRVGSSHMLRQAFPIVCLLADWTCSRVVAKVNLPMRTCSFVYLLLVHREHMHGQVVLALACVVAAMFRTIKPLGLPLSHWSWLVLLVALSRFLTGYQLLVSLLTALFLIGGWCLLSATVFTQ